MSGRVTSKKDSKLKVLWVGCLNLLSMCNNPISILGLLGVACSVLVLITFWMYYLTAPGVNRYLEFVGFLILPAFFGGGLALIPAGIYLRRRRDRKRKTKPAVESETTEHRVHKVLGTVGILMIITVFAVFPVLSVSGYYLYSFTESTRFCGEICHPPMRPQSIAHSRSAHARVACAECHIGHGAGWFVKSKLSGARQVYAVLADTYSRPIPPAITELRPARDTCEECHWPSKFFGHQYKKLTHFAQTEDNRRREVEILLKIGGADDSIGRAEGIHMHMLRAGTVEYMAADEHLQDIPWVKYTRQNGDVTIYRTKGTPIEGLPISGQHGEAVMRTIDCMDCHNRGAHHFRSPQISIDLELEANRIDRALPYIKRESVAALVEPYPDEKSATTQIEHRLLEYYKKSWPEVFKEQENKIREAIKRVQSVYLEDFFPDMKEDWRTYPENIGHQYSPGCFRCHDGQHSDEKGRTISSDCTVCHLFITPVDGEPDKFNFGKFEHPNSLSVHKNVRCSTCHSSGKRPRCEQCHEPGEWKQNRGKGLFRRADEPENERDAGSQDSAYFGHGDHSFRSW